jgi:8-oxo-dGTP diphosphatase
MAEFDHSPSGVRYRVTPRTLSFVTHADALLLLKGAADKPLFPGLYNGVGGHVEADEDVFAAAYREIREETGLDVRDLTLRGMVNVSPAPGGPPEGVLLFVFRARASSRTVRASAEGALAWVAREALAELPLVEDLPLLLPSVLDAAPEAPPFFGHYARDGDGRLTAHFSP